MNGILVRVLILAELFYRIEKFGEVSYTTKKVSVELLLKPFKNKSARRGSNPRPPPWQGGAPPLSHSRISSTVSNSGYFGTGWIDCQYAF